MLDSGRETLTARRDAHRVDDLLVPGAAAEVAGECLADLAVVRIGISREEICSRHEQPRRAEAALHRPRRQESVLQRVELRPFGERLDGTDLPAVDLDGRDEARAHELAVEPDRAGAALTFLACVPSADQTELVAQHREQTRLRRHVDPVLDAVDCRENQHRSSSTRASARRASTSTT